MGDASDADDGPPPRLDVEALGDRLSAASGLLLCLDFDGTLTPIAADPDAPSLPAANRRSLQALAGADPVRVAVVSGRGVADLRARVGVDDVVYAGNHGLEVRRDGETTVPPAAERSREAIETLLEALDDRLGDVDGVVLEDKGVTATVHYRQVPEERADDVQETVEEVLSAHDDDRIDVQVGKQVVELRPAVDRHKGSVVRELREAVGADWVTVYLGDDTTDEDAFGVLDDDASVGVHVGSDPETAADRRLPDPAAVEDLLAWLADEGVARLG